MGKKLFHLTGLLAFLYMIAYISICFSITLSTSAGAAGAVLLFVIVVISLSSRDVNLFAGMSIAGLVFYVCALHSANRVESDSAVYVYMSSDGDYSSKPQTVFEFWPLTPAVVSRRFSEVVAVKYEYMKVRNNQSVIHRGYAEFRIARPDILAQYVRDHPDFSGDDLIKGIGTLTTSITSESVADAVLDQLVPAMYPFLVRVVNE